MDALHVVKSRKTGNSFYDRDIGLETVSSDDTPKVLNLFPQLEIIRLELVNRCM